MVILLPEVCCKKNLKLAGELALEGEALAFSLSKMLSQLMVVQLNLSRVTYLGIVL